MTRYQPRSLAPLPMTAKLTPHALRCILAEHEQPPTEPPHAGMLESLSPSHTLRPVIDELCESAAETASRYSLTYDPAVDAAARGLLSASCLSGAQLEALQARLASEHRPITDRAAWSEPVAPTWAPGGIPDLPTTKAAPAARCRSPCMSPAGSALSPPPPPCSGWLSRPSWR